MTEKNIVVGHTCPCGQSFVPADLPLYYGVRHGMTFGSRPPKGICGICGPATIPVESGAMIPIGGFCPCGNHFVRQDEVDIGCHICGDLAFVGCGWWAPITHEEAIAYLEGRVSSLEEERTHLRVEVATLQRSSGVWSALRRMFRRR